MTAETVVTLVCAIFASTGFWAFITHVMSKHSSKLSNESKLLRGMAHDRICFLGEKYIHQGWITRDDYENLYEYLYIPYRDLGGNGTAARVIQEVQKLPLKKD